eukprot:jgi/Tetstr1/422976/TSEL_013754.t2
MRAVAQPPGDCASPPGGQERASLHSTPAGGEGTPHSQGDHHHHHQTPHRRERSPGLSGTAREGRSMEACQSDWKKQRGSPGGADVLRTPGARVASPGAGEPPLLQSAKRPRSNLEVNMGEELARRSAPCSEPDMDNICSKRYLSEVMATDLSKLNMAREGDSQGHGQDSSMGVESEGGGGGGSPALAAPPPPPSAAPPATETPGTPSWGSRARDAYTMRRVFSPGSPSSSAGSQPAGALPPPWHALPPGLANSPGGGTPTGGGGPLQANANSAAAATASPPPPTRYMLRGIAQEGSGLIDMGLRNPHSPLLTTPKARRTPSPSSSILPSSLHNWHISRATVKVDAKMAASQRSLLVSWN